MAARRNLQQDANTRAKIQTSQLINRLNDNANGKIEMTNSQVKSAEILLRKTLPDLSAVTLSGDKDNPLEIIHSVVPDLAKKLDRLSNK